MDSFMLFVIIALVLFILFELMTIIKGKGVWRYVFFIPSLFVIGVIVWMFIDMENNPKSHNLLPFELLIYLCYAVAIHVVLVIARMFIAKLASRKKTT